MKHNTFQQQQWRALLANMSGIVELFVSTAGAFLPMFVGMTRGDRHVNRRVDNKWLHLYEPMSYGSSAALEPNAVVVFVHGGGWIAGSIEEGADAHGDISYAPIGRSLASRGITTALVGYPRCYVPPSVHVVVYAVLAVFAYALAVVLSWIVLPRWFWHALSVPCYVVSAYLLRSRALSWNQDPTATFATQRDVVRQQIRRVSELYPRAPLVLVGHSAGAHMVALECWDGHAPPNVQRVVLLSGPYDLTALTTMSPPMSWFVSELLLRPAFRGVDLASVSPLKMLPAADVPRACAWNVVTAKQDIPLLYAQAREFYDKLKFHFGAASKVYRIEDVGVGHGAGMVFDNTLWNTIIHWVNYPSSHH